MSFFPENYQPPEREVGNYFKLAQGHNLIRILSKPLIGWEIWVDGKPVRYPADKKPEPSGDQKVKEFWSLIVWSYEHKKIQVIHLHQESIKKGVRDLIEDVAWGSPCDYDIRITRTGHELKTKYVVAPTPKSPVQDHIKQAFYATPCLLDVLFTGDDPFGPWTRTTIPLWDLAVVNTSKSITEAQYHEILSYIGDDKAYLQKVSAGVKSLFKVDLISQLPVEHFEKVLGQVKLYAQERLKKEMDSELPF